MSENLFIGELITDDRCRTATRDAIHVAIAPVMAIGKLSPGQHIGFVVGSTTEVEPARECIGIVDPFLRSGVRRGDMFYMFLYPGTITSLRHDWTHPSFSVGEFISTDPDVRWVTDLAKGYGLSYDELMNAAEDYVEYEDYLCHGPRFDGEYIPDEFWAYYQRIKGVEVPENRQRSFFSCSC